MINNNKNKTKYVVQAGLIAAIYIITTYISAAFGLAYGGIQFRISEILTILPVFTNAAIPGLALGCFLSNLASPLGAIDWICGTIATLTGAIGTRMVKDIKFRGIPFLSPLMPTLTNTLIVGLLLVFTSEEGATLMLFITMGLGIFISELVCCYLGLPLFILIKKSKIFKFLF